MTRRAALLSLGSVEAVTLLETLTRTGTTRNLFRTVAIAEAFSWAGLLTGMYFKWIAETTEAGVKIFGPIHGGIFITYVVITFLASRSFGWNLKMTLLALASAIPPFATYAFEVWADRGGKLGVDRAQAAA